MPTENKLFTTGIRLSKVYSVGRSKPEEEKAMRVLKAVAVVVTVVVLLAHELFLLANLIAAVR